MNCLRFYFGKPCRAVDDFFAQKSCKIRGNVVILSAGNIINFKNGRIKSNSERLS